MHHDRQTPLQRQLDDVVSLDREQTVRGANQTIDL
jgi:hypothetical protein